MCTSVSRPRRSRSGFTLVELLTVIVIISILAAMVTAAVIMARITARHAVMRTDINQLEMTLEQYKTDFGEYPPDFAGLDSNDPNPAVKAAAIAKAQDRVLSHIRKRFPRYVCPDWATFRTAVLTATSDFNQDGTPGDPESPGLDVNNLTAASALVFWLGGLPEYTTNSDAATSKTLTGFSADPANPFQSKATTSSRIPALAQFSASQLSLGQPVPPATGSCPLEYHPSGRTKPYVYVKAYISEPIDSVYYVGTVVQPYFDSGTNNWVNPTTYQIICAGMDDGYGATTAATTPTPPPPVPAPLAARFPSGSNFDNSAAATATSGTHFDNITNFTSTTIQAAMSK